MTKRENPRRRERENLINSKKKAIKALEKEMKIKVLKESQEQ